MLNEKQRNLHFLQQSCFHYENKMKSHFPAADLSPKQCRKYKAMILAKKVHCNTTVFQLLTFLCSWHEDCNECKNQANVVVLFAAWVSSFPHFTACIYEYSLLPVLSLGTLVLIVWILYIICWILFYPEVPNWNRGNAFCLSTIKWLKYL